MPVRFLIADDMPAQQRLLANVVLFLGGESRFASNGRDVIRMAEEEAFDILLLDLAMPELGGVAAANRLLQGWELLTYRPRIVAVTGENDEGTRTLCRAIGMDGYIPKPFSVAGMRKMLKQLLLHGHCWAEGPARRILDVSALQSQTADNVREFEAAVLEARTSLHCLTETTDPLTAQQCREMCEQLSAFAEKHGLGLLAPVMTAVSHALLEDETALARFIPQLQEQTGDFEHAVTAIRAWCDHEPESAAMSA